jgi:hypothetical protein
MVIGFTKYGGSGYEYIDYHLARHWRGLLRLGVEDKVMIKDIVT